MKFKKFNRNLIFIIILAVVVLLVVFGGVLSFIGYHQFYESLTKQYVNHSYSVAHISASVVNGNKIDYYLDNDETEITYAHTQDQLNRILVDSGVTLIYVIKVDTEDYLSFKSVFNSVDPNDSRYKRWSLGYERDTTNEEYATYYKQIYNKEIDRAYIERNKNLGDKDPHITALVPILDINDNVTAILCVQTPMSELKKGGNAYLLNVIIYIIIAIIIVATSYAVYIRNQFIAPLHKVTKEAIRFATHKAEGNKIELENISKINEIDALAKTIGKMEDDINTYIEEVKTMSDDKNRLSMELNVAKIIQSSSVPNTFPAFPNRNDFDIYASMTPAKEVGGDFYNFFFVDDDHLVLMMADVSGKGIGAALFMMVSMILLDDRALLGGTPSQIIKFVNKRICEKNTANLFVTVWLGIVTLSTGEVIACNAGHDDPVVYRNNGEFELLKSKHGIVVGAFDNYEFKDHTFKLEKGDKLFLYTDGIPEATNSYKQMFTIDKMVESLNKHKDLKPERICFKMSEDVAKFVDGSEQFDDMTMLCFEYKGSDEKKRNEITIEAINSNLDKVNDFIFKDLDLDPKTTMQITLSVEEIFTNIANYAYPGGTGNATVRVNCENDVLTITFIDSGIKYNPLENDEPDITLDATDRPIGGLGVFLVKKNMDSVEYEYKNNQNILTMSKKIN